jgi:hypothetical protein
MKEIVAFIVMLYSTSTVEQYLYSLFFYSGSADPTSRNKDKFGRLRFFAENEKVLLGLRGKEKNSIL